MADTTLRCNVPSYFYQSTNLQLRLDYRPVVGSIATGYTFESFLPFFIAALAEKSGSNPNGAPGDATLTFNSNTDQATFPNQSLSQSMMIANRDGANSSGFLTYLPNANRLNYSKYFWRNMQNPGLFQENFGAFLMPSFLMDAFWDDISAFEALVAVYDNLITTRFTEICNRVFSQTDLRLWLPPGIYTMIGTNAPGPNTDPYFANFSALFGTATTAGEKGLILGELKSIE